MYAQIEGNEVKLYGTIWKGDGQFIIAQISSLLAKENSNVNIHLHTDGGNVFDGNLIYNAIANAKANVTIQIDGLAASMGAIIMLASKTIKIAENAFIMIHAPSGDQRGNAKEFENTAKLLRSLEANFIKILSSRSKQTDDEIKDLMNGDNWFSAEEALKAGLVDEIVGVVLENSDLTAYQDVKICAQLFAAYDQTKPEQTPPLINNHKNENEMKLTAESLTVLGLSEKASETEVNAAIEAQNKRIQELETKTTQEFNAKCEALVAKGISEGRILAGEKDAWTADAKANFEMTERVLEKLPIKKSLNPKESAVTSELDDDKRTFDQWRKEDPAGLLKIKQDDPERYTAILAKK